MVSKALVGTSPRVAAAMVLGLEVIDNQDANVRLRILDAGSQNEDEKRGFQFFFWALQQPHPVSGGSGGGGVSVQRRGLQISDDSAADKLIRRLCSQ